jgi:hypothetical protein
MQLQTEAFVSKPILRIRRILCTVVALFLLLESGMKIMEMDLRRALAQLGYPDETSFGAGAVALIIAILFTRFIVRLFFVHPW